MGKIVASFAILMFAALIVGLAQILRNFPLLAAVLAAGPAALTLWVVVLAFLNSMFHSSHSEGTHSRGGHNSDSNQ